MTDTSTNWYTVKVRNNYEKIVSDRIILEMRRLNKEINVIIPKERVFTAKNGKKVFKEKILMPGYIFVETTNVGDLLSVIRETTGATNILKSKEGVLTTLRQSEVNKMIEADTEIKAPVSEELYIIGEVVKIINGPFSDFNGEVDSIDFETKKVKAKVSIFGRKTPVELSFDDITKL